MSSNSASYGRSVMSLTKPRTAFAFDGPSRK
nr:MAG TPA: hypothetical protein [Caudoviricetes sp.]